MLWEVEESPKSGVALEVLREWKQTQDTDIVSFAPLHFSPSPGLCQFLFGTCFYMMPSTILDK